MPHNVNRGRWFFATLMAVAAPSALFAFNLSGQRWGGTSITMQLQLGPTPGTLIDGSSSWGESAEDALATWNGGMINMRFNVVRDSTAAKSNGNGVNNVFWSSTVYGEAWDERTLAVTLSRVTPAGVLSESDVIFNNSLAWNSYRGSGRTGSSGRPLYDFHRVALHEFGHVLGLDHPDDVGQRISAVMNSTTSNTDALTADDFAGAKAIYDTGAPIPSAPSIYMQSPVAYRITGSTLNLQVARVQNDRTRYTTGSLRLDLWAMPSPYDNGLPTGSRLMGRYNLPDVLESGFGYPNININTAYTSPSNGTYYVALVLAEFTGSSSGSYTIRDFRKFDGQLVVGTTTAPTIIAQPFSQTVSAGGNITFAVTASGPAPLSYVWRKDGVALTGATGATLTVNAARPIDAGSYSVVVTNGSGSVTSSSVTLAVNFSRLINLSTRGLVQVGDALTPGFVMRGTGTKQLLIRGIGPALVQFGIPTALTDTRLDVIPGGSSTAQASNDDWGGSATLSAAFSAVGAFPLTVGSRDSAVQSNLAVNSGGYTVRLTAGGAATTGIALAEIYDADSDNSTARLINVSTRGFVGNGENILNPGFVIRGNSAKQLLIRAIGPGLAQFGVTGLLADPQISVIPAGQSVAIASNDNWGGTTTLKAVFTNAGAFSIADASRDAAIVVTLQPGGYTVIVSGVGNTTGNALVEVYDLDP